MSVKKFKFVSPGVFLSEVDNSQLPAAEREIGPLLVGRTQFGPAMRPVTVQSFSEYVETFGNPIPGSAGGDVWRDGNQQGPTYAAYAAQAYLKADVGPVTMVRLLGSENPDFLGSPVAGNRAAAGWATEGTIDPGNDGGAYALVVCNSSSTPDGEVQPAAIAAIWYMDQGTISLSGTFAGPGGATGQTGSYALFRNNGSAFNPEYTAIIKDISGNVVHKTAFNADPDSAKYIRNVFNTNPQLTNGDVVDQSSLNSGEDIYWLGETFEDHLATLVANGTITNPDAMIVALGSDGGTTSRSDMKKNYEEAATGWFISQDLTSDTGSYNAITQDNLFRIVARDAGENAQNTLKVSIQNVKASTSLLDQYGTFDVVVRRANDSDNVVKYVERYTNLSLNPASDNYIGVKIGDKYVEYDTDQKRLREYGEYDNQSKYIRVEIRDDVAAGLTDPRMLPFGVRGPKAPATVLMTSGSVSLDAGGDGSIIVTGSLAADTKATATSMYIAGNYSQHTCSVAWPAVTLRHSASDGGIGNPTDAFFGAQSSTQIGANDNLNFDKGWGDFLRSFPTALQGTLTDSWTFSLDDVVTSGSATAYYQADSRRDGISATAQGDYTSILEAGYDSFTAPLYGGFDGLNIKEIEPFRNSAMSSTDNEFSNYAFNSVQQALNSVADPEVVEYNLLAVPGLTNTKLTQHMINVCEDRADALAVVDLENVYEPSSESTDTFKERVGTPKEAVDALRLRQIDSSYACTYFPWVQVRDTISSRLLWVPPSVIGLGVMANSEAKSEVWFAPAGFNRGGLTEGSAGLPVAGLTYKLTSKERDLLYDASVNPIASFPSEGIVVFGQKTMQVQRSALDRINVRRLMIYIKKQVSRISSGLLFDQNVSVTWERFLNQVNPLLSSIQSRLGLTEFKVILDETTTTPDLVDQNIMYAKIFLKPARAIEFIAVDFVITRSGASFDD
jgi:hypothetical protein